MSKERKRAAKESSQSHDFSTGRRGAVLAQPGKTRITIWLDTDILDAFRKAAERECRGYQTAINDALRAAVAGNALTTEDRLRERIRTVVREELAHLKSA